MPTNFILLPFVFNLFKVYNYLFKNLITVHFLIRLISIALKFQAHYSF